MKVLFISSWYPNPIDKTHGVFVKRTAEAVALYNKVAVIHVYGNESFEEEIKVETRTENNVLEVFVLYKKKKLNPLIKFNNYRKHYLIGLDHLLKSWGTPDLLQVNVLFPAGIAGLMISKKLNIPFVVAEHWTGYHPEDGSYKGIFKKLMTVLSARSASAIITVSNNLKAQMLTHYLNSSYTIIPNVVDPNIFLFEETRSQSKFRFLHVSSLDERQKNVEGIIDAFKNLHKQNPLTELVIVGEGDNKSALEKRAGTFLNQSIIFRGKKMSSELALEFNSAHCCVLFSNFENLPVVLLEAMCCGVPVISSDVGGIKEYVNKGNGYLVKPKDQEALLQSMNRMVKENINFDRKTISDDAQESFNYNRIGTMFTQVYQKVLQTS